MGNRSDFDIKVGLRLKALRYKRSLKKSDVAKILKMSSTALDKIENGMRSLNVKNLQKISKLYGIDMNSIISDGNTECILAEEPKNENIREREFLKARIRFLSDKQKRVAAQIYELIKKIESEEE